MPSRSLALLLLVLAAANSVACRTLEARPIPLEQPALLEPGHGFLLVEIDANNRILELSLDRVEGGSERILFGALSKGRRTMLLQVPEGEYRWNRVELPGQVYRGRDYPYYWNFDHDHDRDHFRFRVDAGKVNYPGVLVLVQDGRWLTSYTLNRSGELAERLHDAAEWLLLRHPVVYTGRRRDDFLSHYTERLQRKRIEAIRSDQGTPDVEG